LKGIREVREFVIAAGMEAEILELSPGSTKTSSSAAASLGCSVAEISKSIAFEWCEAGGETAPCGTVVVVLSGDMLVDERKLRREMNCNTVRKLTPPEVMARTGYAVGGVPPFPHDADVTVLADRSIFRFSTSWAAAGETNAVMRIRPEMLVEKLGYSVADVSVCAEDRRTPLK
jgi:prolyl-tRNA editing enzyme YbaK/EbsC (Cys-tRNA(Pro) deacylase)